MRLGLQLAVGCVVIHPPALASDASLQPPHTRLPSHGLISAGISLLASISSTCLSPHLLLDIVSRHALCLL
ncbi:hypothetical protein BC831DRAFT_495000 [Entophlyctis helioformis]|nr:hypothetical protein BC831DRAFT_495000 [Entophlyctis helioformis]